MEIQNASLFNNSNSNSPSLITTSRIAASCVYIFFCLSGILGYLLYAYVVVRNRKLLSNPFYSLTLSLAVPDCLTNLITLTYGVPSMIATKTGSGSDLAPYWVRDAFGFLSDCCWFTICSHMILIASNRLISIKWPFSYNRLFSRNRLSTLIALSYLSSCIIPIITYYCTCRFEFDQFVWTVDCDQNVKQCSQWILLIDSIYTNGQLSLVLIGNIFILVHVYKKGKKIRVTVQGTVQKSIVQSNVQSNVQSAKQLNKQLTAQSVVGTVQSTVQTRRFTLQPILQNFTLSSSSGTVRNSTVHRPSVQASTEHNSIQRQYKREKALIIQFSCIAFVVIVGQLTFWLLPPIIDRGYFSAELGGFISNMFGILTCSLNPFIYFIFSSEIRKRLRSIDKGATQPANGWNNGLSDWGRQNNNRSYINGGAN